MNRLKRVIRKNEKLLRMVSFIYRLFGLNYVKGRRGVKLLLDGAFVKKSFIDCKGYNNKIIIENGCRLKNCKVIIRGNNNILHIKSDCVGNDLSVWLQDEGSSIYIGNNTWFTGNCHLACIEGKKISIGEKCLLSSEVTFRTGDSHSIVNENNQRINPSADIVVGSHVWIGNKVIILKGSVIGDDSIIGTGTIVTGKKYRTNSLLVGIPAKIIKSDVNWKSENI